MPLVGIIFKADDTFIITWNIRIFDNPVKEEIIKKLLDLWEIKCALVYIIKYIVKIIIADKLPNSSPIRAKIKSEWTSGRFLAIDPSQRPLPKNPPFSKNAPFKKDFFFKNAPFSKKIFKGKL